ncbi:hypothetical protein QJS10_CPA07g00624 [Acorus calamus]|uniref:Uncharacterized protein n=1 Tax=Acorus calamus TaxID=4465 RepID=A0AAV9EGA9_ACOCL|nr:hypothetical protein QJS10_CPA07g00624 [Acorus calamus]
MELTSGGHLQLVPADGAPCGYVQQVYAEGHPNGSKSMAESQFCENELDHTSSMAVVLEEIPVYPLNQDDVPAFSPTSSPQGSGVREVSKSVGGSGDVKLLQRPSAGNRPLASEFVGSLACDKAPLMGLDLAAKRSKGRFKDFISEDMFESARQKLDEGEEC